MKTNRGSRRIAVLGSTGSIGRQALDVAQRERERVRVTGLGAGRALDALCEQARRFRPAALAIEHAADPDAARAALTAACPGATVWVGPGASARLAAHAESDVVVNGIVGAAGLTASLAALRAGRRLALANKETLVVGGPLVRQALESVAGAELIPVDSEHSGALQCLGSRPATDIARLTLTASGGALRDHPEWRRATREEVLAHPVWAMGHRITVDSALLFNKGLELIEARWLFDLDWPALDAVLHRQALVHAIVTFRDGSSVLQAARPDMRLPIQLAISWPERWGPAVTPLAPENLQGLEFAPIEKGRYPAFDLACGAGAVGGTAPCVLNAADEVAVQAFLDGEIALGEVPERVAAVLERHRPEPVESLEQLEAVDQAARAAARAAVVAR
jgi:1-deoxy-D-xylulose-5-phosphate reductoisomerase